VKRRFLVGTECEQVFCRYKLQFFESRDSLDNPSKLADMVQAANRAQRLFHSLIVPAAILKDPSTLSYSYCRSLYFLPHPQPHTYRSTPIRLHKHSPSVSCTGRLEQCCCFRINKLPLWIQHQVIGMDMAREITIVYHQAMDSERLGYDRHAKLLDKLPLPP
jgi:hypothetical protein